MDDEPAPIGTAVKEPSPPGVSRKEDKPLDSVNDLRNKLALVIEKVKLLKDEKSKLEVRVQELESQLALKEKEVREIAFDKVSIKDQINDLLNELETIETG